VEWAFTDNDAPLDFLGEGESRTQTYTVTVNDGLTGTVSQAITVTIHGKNDLPVGKDSVLSTTEDTLFTFKNTDFGFVDADASDTFQGVRIDALPNAGSLTLNGVALNADTVVSAADISAGNLKFIAAANANGDGYAHFGFSVQDSASGFDSSSNQIILNVAAVNDIPTISLSGATITGSVTEIADLAVGENLTLHTQTGQLGLGEVDFADVLSAYANANAGGYVGSFSVTIPNNTTGDGAGSLIWNYSVGDDALNFLGAGETRNQVYTINVNDGHGGNAYQDITITLNGTNDAPQGANQTITAGGDGWTNAHTAYAAPIGSYIGRYGWGGEELSKLVTWEAPSDLTLTPMVTIGFDLLEFDSWDGERFRVYAGDHELVNIPLYLYNSAPTSGFSGTGSGANTGMSWTMTPGTNGNLNNSGWSDQAFHMRLNVPADLDGIKLRFN